MILLYNPQSSSTRKPCLPQSLMRKWVHALQQQDLDAILVERGCGHGSRVPPAKGRIY